MTIDPTGRSPTYAQVLKAGQKVATRGFGAGLEGSSAKFATPPQPDPPPTLTDAPLDIPMRDGRLERARVYKGDFVLGNPTDVAETARAIAVLQRRPVSSRRATVPPGTAESIPRGISSGVSAGACLAAAAAQRFVSA
ncbi:hypothetical protein AURDEDRAFT_167511 [Auricularia subglabra TFB-10046 SS5]|nr:hypothetical protein AURDEDRAFT_167511 [Auricularia subglabra TFB-10046 SS5]